MAEVTQILKRIESGDPSETAQLLPLVYRELRRLAALRLQQESPGQTLNATALVHEAYLRLVDVEQAQHWDSRGHFFAAASEAMRRILVENARRKNSLRGGGGVQREYLDPDLLLAGDRDHELLALDEAIDRLEQIDSAKASVVKLRYFAGLTIPQTAEALQISTTTANRYWAYARAWLHEEMGVDRGGSTA